MDLKERLGIIKENITASIPHRNLSHFLSTLAGSDSRGIMSKKEIDTRIQNLPFEALNIFLRSYNNYASSPFTSAKDARDNVWQITSSTARHMEIIVSNKSGRLTVSSSYLHTDTQEVKNNHAVLWNPFGTKIMAEFLSTESHIEITRPIKQ